MHMLTLYSSSGYLLYVHHQTPGYTNLPQDPARRPLDTMLTADSTIQWAMVSLLHSWPKLHVSGQDADSMHTAIPSQCIMPSP